MSQKNAGIFPRFHTPEQAAEILQIHVKTLARHAKERRIGHRVGHLWRFTLDDIERLAREAK